MKKIKPEHVNIWAAFASSALQGLLVTVTEDEKCDSEKFTTDVASEAAQCADALLEEFLNRR